MDERRGELVRRLAAVRDRIDRACVAAGRAPGSVALLAIAKTIPATDVATLIDLGVTAFGENRVQEAEAKVADVAALCPDASPRWHLVGGVPRGELDRLAEHVAGCAGLQLDGLMAVAPLGADPDAAFADVAEASAHLRAAFPQAKTLSAGMSGDLEAAIRHGSDVVRVGTALVGERPLTSR